MTRSIPTLALTLLLALIPAAANADERPLILASLHPVALLTAEIAGDQARVDSLVPAGGSPHTYSMRPSERRKLESAVRFIWIGPEMETFLERVLSQPSLADKTLRLSRVLGQDSNNHSHHHHDHGHSDEAESAPVVLRSDDDGQDPHLWLDPALSVPMARMIAESLKSLDGIDDGRIDANLAAFEQAFRQETDAIRDKLRPVQSVAIFTYHDAFRRYGDYFDLHVAGHLTINPERSPGARRVAEIRDALNSVSTPCVMTEPQFRRDWWQGLANNMDLGLSTWDPLGTDHSIAQGGYIAFLQGLADAALACLD